MSKKPKLGVYGFTGCAGCQLAILDCEDILVDFFKIAEIKVFYEATSNNDDEAEVDVALVEGSINTDRQLEELKKIREKAKILIAFGTCSLHGGVQAMAYKDGNWEKRFKKVYGDVKFEVANPIEATPINKFVKIDGYIPGCPPSTPQMLQSIAKLLHGILPTYRDAPVCLECKFKENECLLNKGIICLGPLTKSGCGAVCPSHNTGCIGCWGIIEESNHKSLLQKLLDSGFTKEDIIRKFRIFGGADYTEKIKSILED